jgi:hypothetical protein
MEKEAQALHSDCIPSDFLVLLGLEYDIFPWTPFLETMDEMTITHKGIHGSRHGKETFFGFVPSAASSAVREKGQDDEGPAFDRPALLAKT